MSLRITSVLRRIVAAAAAWRRQRDDARQMMAMSEAELRDLGIGRGQIPALLSIDTCTGRT